MLILNVQTKRSRIEIQKIISKNCINTFYNINKTNNAMFNYTECVNVCFSVFIEIYISIPLLYPIVKKKSCFENIDLCWIWNRKLIHHDFILFQGQMLKVQSEKTIQKSNLDPKKPTKFIIHGFIDTPLSNWVKVIKIIIVNIIIFITIIMSFLIIRKTIN